MAANKLQTIESPSGIGQVYQDGQVIARVMYNLHIQQELIAPRSPDDTWHVFEPYRTSGQLIHISGQRNLANCGVLTLLLADGRWWQFLVSEVNLLLGLCQVADASAEGLRPKHLS